MKICQSRKGNTYGQKKLQGQARRCGAYSPPTAVVHQRLQIALLSEAVTRTAGVDMSKKGTSGKMLPNHSNLTPEEVRKFLRISKSKVYEMIEAGEIASKKVGR